MVTAAHRMRVGFRAGLAMLTGGALLVSSVPASAATKPKATTKTTKTAKATVTTRAAVTTKPTATTKPGATYGRQADGTYLGKGDFRIDLSKCPKDYNPNQGISATEVKLFTSTPKSGPAAGFGALSDGMNSYFKYVSDQGGVAGRKITMDIRDDSYLPDKTKANITEAIASAKYAALVAVLGTPNSLAVWDDTNKECMPQLLNASGAAQWGDVDGHPWTTGGQLDYGSEAALWANWVKKDFPNGAKVGMLTFNSDFGLSYSKGFRAAIKGSKTTVVKEELHDATAPNLTNQLTNLEAALPDVILLQTTGAFCTQALAELEKRGYKGKVMISLTCGQLTQYFKPLIDLGLTGKDTYVIQTVKDISDAEFANDPFVKLVKATLKAQGLDPTVSTYGTGWVFAWYMTEILKEAATYQGGLNRPNIMLAARGLDKTMPLMLDGITNRMDGMNDAYLNEGGRVARYKVSDPKQLGTWFPQGAVINNEGALGTYKKFLASAG